MYNEVLVGVTFGIFALVLFALYNVYSGVHGCLSSARVGEVYNFDYLQPLTGENERFLVKVLDVATLNDDQINRLNAKSNYRRSDSNFQRTRHLITGQSPDGSVRNFYAERVTNCRRPLLGGLLLKSGVAALIF